MPVFIVRETLVKGRHVERFDETHVSTRHDDAHVPTGYLLRARTCKAYTHLVCDLSRKARCCGWRAHTEHQTSCCVVVSKSRRSVLITAICGSCCTELCV